jgi:hypothetical protein
MITPEERLAPIRERLAALTAGPCQPSEKSMTWSGPVGGCAFCDQRISAGMDWMERLSRPMLLCIQCGNKRCPKALWHENHCTASNEPGQPAQYPDPLPVETQASLLAALEAALALHQPQQEQTWCLLEEECEDCYPKHGKGKGHVDTVCSHCRTTFQHNPGDQAVSYVRWPCPTVTTITAVLDGQV